MCQIGGYQLKHCGYAHWIQVDLRLYCSPASGFTVMDSSFALEAPIWQQRSLGIVFIKTLACLINMTIPIVNGSKFIPRKETRIMEKITYNATELAALLGISRYAAYNLMHRADFPSFRIGKRLLVTHVDTLAWLNKQPHEEDPRPP